MKLDSSRSGSKDQMLWATLSALSQQKNALPQLPESWELLSYVVDQWVVRPQERLINYYSAKAENYTKD